MDAAAAAAMMEQEHDTRKLEAKASLGARARGRGRARGWGRDERGNEHEQEHEGQGLKARNPSELKARQHNLQAASTRARHLRLGVAQPSPPRLKTPRTRVGEKTLPIAPWPFLPALSSLRLPSHQRGQPHTPSKVENSTKGRKQREMREEKNARNSSEHQLVDAKHDAGDARRADGGLFEDAAEGEVLFERTNRTGQEGQQAVAPSTRATPSSLPHPHPHPHPNPHPATHNGQHAAGGGRRAIPDLRLSRRTGEPAGTTLALVLVHILIDNDSGTIEVEPTARSAQSAHDEMRDESH
ncbi:hypothetical protein B0H13DRAFT_2443941 [Mycena leptocephala]|nr:hypothetical protein B0H13DRAFT_2443941 [Mycena leptocephala]